MIYSEFRGLKISKIGLGTVQFGVDYGFTKKKSQNEVDSILEKALELGINFVDTAREYGDSEAKIGSFLKLNPGADFIIATKLKKIPASGAYDVKKHVLASVNDSLAALHTGKIDVLQLHEIPERLVSDLSFWEGIAEVKKAGKVVYFGVSVYEPDETSELIKKYGDLIDFVQVPYNIFDRRFESLFALLKQKGVGIIARSIFLKGVIAAEMSRIPEELAGLRPFKIKLGDISKKTRISVPYLALLYVVDSGSVASAILGVNSASELEANVEALKQLTDFQKIRTELNELNVTDLALIDPRRWKTI